MTATAKLYRVFLVEKQIRGLRSRLNTAERFLKAQQTQLEGATRKRDAADAQMRQLKAQSAERENEAQTIEERIEHLREQMNEAKTNREYKAFLTEVNTFKAEKERVETEAFEIMTKIDELSGEHEQLGADTAEREKMVDLAKQQRDEREAEIKDRLKELETEYKSVREGAPADALRVYDEQLTRDPDEDPMASVEVHDRKRHVYSCTSCMIELPKEAVSSLLSHGSVYRCPSCDVILYIEQDTAEALTPG